VWGKGEACLGVGGGGGGRGEGKRDSVCVWGGGGGRECVCVREREARLERGDRVRGLAPPHLIRGFGFTGVPRS
jgi:hypothetical protein